MNEREIGVEEARKVLGDLADDAGLDGVLTYLTRHRRRVAAIVPLDRIAEESAVPELVMAHRGPDGRPAFQPVSDRHRDEPGVVPAVDVAGLSDEAAEDLVVAAEKHRRKVGRQAQKRQQQRYGKTPQPSRSGPLPHFGWEYAGDDQINVWFRHGDDNGKDVWTPYSSLVLRWDSDSNDTVVVEVPVDKEVVRAALARGESIPMAQTRSFPSEPQDLQLTPIPWRP